MKCVSRYKARAYQGDATCHTAVLEDKLMQDLSKRGMEAGWLASYNVCGEDKKILLHISQD
jgi:hypothetical protein